MRGPMDSATTLKQRFWCRGPGPARTRGTPVVGWRRKKAHRAALVATQTRVKPTQWEKVKFTGRSEMLEATRNIDGRDLEKFGTLGSSEKTIAILEDRWWPRRPKKKEIR